MFAIFIRKIITMQTINQYYLKWYFCQISCCELTVFVRFLLRKSLFGVKKTVKLKNKNTDKMLLWLRYIKKKIRLYGID